MIAMIPPEERGEALLAVETKIKKCAKLIWLFALATAVTTVADHSYAGKGLPDRDGRRSF